MILTSTQAKVVLSQKIGYEKCGMVLSASLTSDRWWRGIYRHLQKSNRYNIIAQLGETEVKTRLHRLVQNVATLGFSVVPIYTTRIYQFWPDQGVPHLGDTDSPNSEIPSLGISNQRVGH